MVGGRIIVPHRRRILRAGAAAAPGSWAGWDEQSESTLDVDQDGDGNEDTFICFFENTNAGGDETGRGGDLTGSDLIISQVGNVAGATGSPPTRDLGDNSQYFTMPNEMMSVLAGTTTWTFITKLKDAWAETAEAGILRIKSAGDNDSIYMRSSGTDEKLKVFLREGTTTLINFEVTTNAWNTTGDVWFFGQCDGSEVVFGFHNSKPTSLSAIPAGNKLTYSGTAQFSPYDGSENYLFYDNGNVSAIRGAAYYVVLAKTALIGP